MVNTVALVVPCFNEAARWDAPKLLALASLPAVLLVLVDDGSKDDTGRLMNELSGVTGCVVLSLGSNSGKAEAVRHGLLHALDHTDAEIVGFLDADGAFDPQDVERMITLAEGSLACGHEWAAHSKARFSSLHRTRCGNCVEFCLPGTSIRFAVWIQTLCKVPVPGQVS